MKTTATTRGTRGARNVPSGAQCLTLGLHFCKKACITRGKRLHLCPAHSRLEGSCGGSDLGLPLSLQTNAIQVYSVAGKGTAFHLGDSRGQNEFHSQQPPRSHCWLTAGQSEGIGDRFLQFSVRLYMPWALRLLSSQPGCFGVLSRMSTETHLLILLLFHAMHWI